MGKANKRSKTQGKRKKGPVIWAIAGIAIVILVIAISGKMPTGNEEKGRSFQITEKETRPVLDPSLFTGMTRAAYAAAQRYPDAMNEVYCYCYCDQPPFNHKSLLSCFTERHGAG
jgi:flagellar basal body-associated protein FliL